MLLWHRFGAHTLGKCCCGIGLVQIGLENVAEATVLGKSAWVMLLWLNLLVLFVFGRPSLLFE